MQGLIKVAAFVLGLTAWLSSPQVLAEKPSWAGQGKPSAEQRAEHKAAMTSKRGDDDQEADDDNGKPNKDKKDKKLKKDNKAGKGKPDNAGKPDKADMTEKAANREMKEQAGEKGGDPEPRKAKTEAMMKELDKGSEVGQESRQERRKWWQFWD